MLTVDYSELPLKRGMRFLDAGCGGGRHICEAYRTTGVDVAGMDLNWTDLCKTRGYLTMLAEEQKGNWILACADVTELPYADATFDVVVCSEVLEHISDSRRAVAELVRVLKPMGDLVVSVPRYLPETICWKISDAYHQEEGGHVRIFKKRELLTLLEQAGTRCWGIRYQHGLHSPYWWLKCLVGHKNERPSLVRAYKKFLEWDIMEHPPLTRMMEWILNPLIGKSIIFYLKKG